MTLSVNSLYVVYSLHTEPCAPPKVSHKNPSQDLYPSLMGRCHDFYARLISFRASVFPDGAPAIDSFLSFFCSDIPALHSAQTDHSRSPLIVPRNQNKWKKEFYNGFFLLPSFWSFLFRSALLRHRISEERHYVEGQKGIHSCYRNID